MKPVAIAILLLMSVLIPDVDAAKKQQKKAPSPKPQPSVKDLAIAEARKCDANGDGKITGSEVSQLRAIWPKNPKSWLYLFDDNSNHMLDDAEIAAIKFAPASKPKAQPAKPGSQPPKKKK